MTPGVRGGVIFSSLPIADGGLRVIRGFVRRGERCLAIGRQVDGVERSPVYVYPDHLALFSAVLQQVRRGALGRWDAGEIECANGVRIKVWASVFRGGGVVGLGRLAPNGRRLGGPITLSGEELRGLARGIAWMQGQERAEVGAAPLIGQGPKIGSDRSRTIGSTTTVAGDDDATLRGDEERNE